MVDKKLVIGCIYRLQACLFCKDVPDSGSVLISFLCFPDESVLIFSSKDVLRDCGAIQALCRLLSLNRDPLILQHVLASLASLSFENER